MIYTLYGRRRESIPISRGRSFCMSPGRNVWTNCKTDSKIQKRGNQVRIRGFGVLIRNRKSVDAI